MSYSATTIAPTVLGDSTVDTANWDETHPSFFSGTNCKASATTSAVTGYVTDLQLLVGGALVDEYLDTPDHPQNPHQSSATLKVVFDSSHFPDTAVEPIKAVVTDSGGNTYSGQITGPIYNLTYVLGNQTLAYGKTAADDVDARAASADWDPNESTSDTKAAIIPGIPIYTGFYFDTHSGAGNFGDCLWPNSGNGGIIYAADVSGAVAKKTVDTPPYNLVFIDGCNSASDNTLSNAFGIGGTDTCFIGYTTEDDDTAHNVNWSNDVWSYLDGGDTVKAALNDATNEIGAPTDGGVAAVPKPFGDVNTTIHATAYGAPKGNWFNPQP